MPYPNIRTIGCDPEFQVRSVLGFTAKDAGRFISGTTIGTDCGNGELRPRHATTWQGLFINLKNLIHELPERVDPTKFGLQSGNGRNVPLGGHIHFGGNIREIADGSLSERRFNGVEDGSTRHRFVASFLHNLDTFVLDPLLAVSNPKRVSMRQNSGYGGRSLWAYKSHGSGMTFEYRSPPSFLCHPVICAGMLCVARVVARNTTRRLEDWDDVLSLATNADRQMIERYQAFLAEMTTKEFTLEDFEMYDAWGIRPILPARFEYMKVRTKVLEGITFNPNEISIPASEPEPQTATVES
jgi:hypothetical protein